MAASRSLLLAVLASLLLLGVLAANGRPLFYFDTAGYLVQGDAMLGRLGWVRPEPPAPGPAAIATDGAEAPEAAGGGDAEPADEGVVGSRSAAYGLALAALDRTTGLGGAVALNLAAVWAATWLAARQVTGGGRRAAVGLAARALLVASLGALPFYVAFLMPDVLAPVLILAVATLCAFGAAMGRGAVALALGLAAAAVLAHPTHLLLVAALAPVALLASPSLAGRRSWVAGGLVALVLALGLGERLAFGALVERFERREVLYLPFLTARLIDDGPGLAALERDCPDAAIPTCLLHAPLAAKTDPQRLDAPMILFSRAPATSSFLALPEADRAAVSRDQLRFAWSVLRDDPLGVALAVARNTADQLRRVRIDMTLMTPEAAAGVRAAYGPVADELREGRLARLPARALDALALLHGALDLVALAAIAILVARRRRADLAAFAGVALAGILLNALICGAISEPADRYGARVTPLLPLVAVLLAGAARRPRRAA